MHLVETHAFILIVIQKGHVHLLAINIKLFVLIQDFVARHAHHTLDVINRRIRWVMEYKYITTLWMIHLNKGVIQNRHTQTISEFVDQNKKIGRAHV